MEKNGKKTDLIVGLATTAAAGVALSSMATESAVGNDETLDEEDMNADVVVQQQSGISAGNAASVSSRQHAAANADGNVTVVSPKGNGQPISHAADSDSVIHGETLVTEIPEDVINAHASMAHETDVIIVPQNVIPQHHDDPTVHHDPEPFTPDPIDPEPVMYGPPVDPLYPVDPLDPFDPFDPFDPTDPDDPTGEFSEMYGGPVGGFDPMGDINSATVVDIDIP